MSRLVLVRHGQASFFADNYDKLSEMGERQSARLAEHWLEKGEGFDEVYVGTLQRQRRTAEVAGEVFAAAGQDWPEATVLPGLNEYPSDEIMDVVLPQLMEREERFVELKEAFDAAEESRERYRSFHRLLSAVMEGWIESDYDANGLMPWTQFRDGVRGALKEIMSAEGSGRRVAVFSSGGPIGVSVQTVLQAPDKMAAELNWRVHNCSTTEFTFSGPRVALDHFNAIAHFTDPEMLTFR